ncbi:MAG: protein translocase subunit SecD [Gammaproteobacteria bacterium]|nr:protein translocase subunit SecD [Gammaproteobacteria bacterium]
MNQYPLWKNLLILVLVLVGAVYALPNLYGNQPAIQISAVRGAAVDDATLNSARNALEKAGLTTISVGIKDHGIVIRFKETETQLKAQDLLRDTLGDQYVVAMNLLPAAPEWLGSINAEPMFLGLDLRGGVHFLMQVDMVAAIGQAEERYVSDLRGLMRNEKVRYQMVTRRKGGGLEIKFKDASQRQAGESVIAKNYPALLLHEQDDPHVLVVEIGKKELDDTRKLALEQNVITLRNRVNELGVAEPIIQQQGNDRIVVQLPGVQDPTRAKEILGATATLEFHMVDGSGDAQAALAGKVPPGERVLRERNGNPVLLYKQIIVTGNQIIDASAGLDQQSGSPAVFISLDGKGARKMLETTRENVGKPMGVVFIENKTSSEMVDGKRVRKSHVVQEVINIATIRSEFSKRFQITGLDSSEEARNLALLLRAGALAAPMEIVEERTVGPSLGQENIEQGFVSVVIGFVVVLVFMGVWYKVFGLVANLALAFNLILIVALLSMFQATLTMPGIAGIVLTVGMAVDANVLIFERIREELRNGNSPQASINAGYSKAMMTIADANITTLLAAIVLFAFGTGPIKGFAVTLSIGILTSMFTAILGTRAVINLIYGRRRITKLSV